MAAVTTTEELIRQTDKVIADLRAAVAASRRVRGAEPFDDTETRLAEFQIKQHGRTS